MFADQIQREYFPKSTDFWLDILDAILLKEDETKLWKQSSILDRNSFKYNPDKPEHDRVGIMMISTQKISQILTWSSRPILI